jgi:hypothetical protein
MGWLKAFKTLSGIEINAITWQKTHKGRGSKPLKPYQGLKCNLPHFETRFILRLKAFKTLSGIGIKRGIRRR